MQRSAYVKTVCFALFSLFLVVSIISFPKQAFEASLRGFTIWWDVVFPALLPFFITAELLMGFGVVHFLGVLLEPIMRPLFRIPGAGGFVLSMGIASGYPMGAKLSVRLRERLLISRAEAERLVAISSTSGPLFMIGAVAVGFFHDVRLGIIIAVAHYISAICVGLIIRFHAPQDTERSVPLTNDQHDTVRYSVFYRALRAMHRARVQDGRTLGTLMRDAVNSSVYTLLTIGGFIIMFSVLMNILDIVGFQSTLSFIFSILLMPLGINVEIIHAFIVGLFEITLGSQLASEAAPSVPIIHKIAFVSAIIAWSGLSVHAQVASIIASTDIRYYPYLIARMMHAFLAFIWTYLLWNPLFTVLNRGDQPVFAQPGETGTNMPDFTRYTLFSYSLLLVLFTLIIIACILFIAKRKNSSA
jgi:sporulation integral membrane protein YlbJ